MKQRESLYPKDWMRVAKKDLRRVEALLGIEDAEAAGLYLQQAAEKSLKAFLLRHGRPLKRIHDLEVLLNEAVTIDASLEAYRGILQEISAYYIIERYPMLPSREITADDVKNALEKLRPFFKRMQRAFAKS